MKRIVLLVTFLVVMALCASAQTYIDFHQLPPAGAPTLMPDYYPEGANLYWDNFYYVTPGLWTDAGPGFWVDPATHHNTVAFMGGPLCSLALPCTGSIKLIPRAGALSTFTPVSISMTAGWTTNKVTVRAYNNSKFVGTVTWQLTNKPQAFVFPVTWKNVTQLVFAPDFNLSPVVKGNAGSMVIYSFVLMIH